MGSTMKDAELRRLIARTVTELLAKDVKHTIAIPVIRSPEDIRKKPGLLIQSLWALPGLRTNLDSGMEHLLYLSDSAELVCLKEWTKNDGHDTTYHYFLHTVVEVDDHDQIVSSVLEQLMEFRESHGLQS